MNRRKLIARCTARTPAVSWGWLLLCLLAALAVILALGLSVPARAAGNSSVQYISSVTNSDRDCDLAERLSGSHCHATVACSAYAQLPAATVPSVDTPTVRPLPVSQQSGDSRALLPNLQPPQYSSQV